jgi:hypothetical protein
MGYITLAAVLSTGLTLAAQSHHHAAAPVSPAALKQIDEVKEAMRAITTPDQARAAGFEAALGWIPMMGTHWVHGPRMLAGKNDTRSAPTQLMFSPVGGKETLVGIAYAYYAPVADTVTPVLFDGAPAWHDHPDLAPPGTNMQMLHVWFVDSPDGPFAGLNPYLPYWAAGVTPPPVARMHDPTVGARVRKAALGLAEIVETAGLFPVLARRPAGGFRERAPPPPAAPTSGDEKRWDALVDKIGAHFDVMKEAYIQSALDPTVKSRIAKAIDDMIRGGHSK